jgi:hypothetical protein
LESERAGISIAKEARVSTGPYRSSVASKPGPSCPRPAPLPPPAECGPPRIGVRIPLVVVSFAALLVVAASGFGLFAWTMSAAFATFPEAPH